MHQTRLTKNISVYNYREYVILIITQGKNMNRETLHRMCVDSCCTGHNHVYAWLNKQNTSLMTEYDLRIYNRMIELVDIINKLNTHYYLENPRILMQIDIQRAYRLIVNMGIEALYKHYLESIIEAVADNTICVLRGIVNKVVIRDTIYMKIRQRAINEDKYSLNDEHIHITVPDGILSAPLKIAADNNDIMLNNHLIDSIDAIEQIYRNLKQN